MIEFFIILFIIMLWILFHVGIPTSTIPTHQTWPEEKQPKKTPGELIAEMKAKLQKQQNSTAYRLDTLRRELVYTPGERDQRIFDKLRFEYESFKKEVINKDLWMEDEILPKIDGLFEACIKELQRNIELGRQEKSITKRDMASLTKRNKLSARRNKILDEVDKTADRMRKLIDKFENISDADHGGQLAKLQDELDQGLEIARRVEERMEDLERRLDEKRDSV